MKQKKGEQSKEFKARVVSLKNKLNTGTYIEKSTDTLLNILERYIEQKNKDGITCDRSYLRDKETLNQIKITCSKWIDKPIQKVIVEDIENSKENMRNYSNSTIQKIWILLNKGFKIAYSRRKIQFNVMNDENLKKPLSLKSPRTVTALSKEEEYKFINTLKTLNHKYCKILLLQLYTGMRIGEVLALTKDCIDFKANTITIYRTLTRDKKDKVILGKNTKTYDKKTGIDKGKRTFFMKPEVKKIIEEIFSSKLTNIHNLLFWDYDKNYFVTDGEINAFLARLNKKYNILSNRNETLSSHRLRHTFITRCQECGMSLPVIQMLVGHSNGSIITTNVYTDISLDFIQQELNKLS